jgi:hypothetical protein
LIGLEELSLVLFDVGESRGGARHRSTARLLMNAISREPPARREDPPLSAAMSIDTATFTNLLQLLNGSQGGRSYYRIVGGQHRTPKEKRR